MLSFKKISDCLIFVVHGDGADFFFRSKLYHLTVLYRILIHFPAICQYYLEHSTLSPDGSFMIAANLKELFEGVEIILTQATKSMIIQPG